MLKLMTIIIFLLCLHINGLAQKSAVITSADLQEEYIREPVFGDSIYLLQAGQTKDTTIILIHGAGNLGAAIWDGIISELREHFHIIAFDLPGFGRSTKQNTLYSPERYVSFLDWLIGRYAKDQIILIGHSLGGGIALCYAGSQQRPLAKLVLVDVCGVLHRASLTKYMAQYEISHGPRLLKKSVTIVNDIWHSLLDGLERPQVDEDLNHILHSESLRAKILKADPGMIAGLALVQYDFSQVIDRIRVPTLLVWGANDEITPLRTAHILKAKIPQSQLEIIQNTSHSPPSERADLFNEIVIQWLLQPAEKSSPEVPSDHHSIGTGLRNANFLGLQDTTICGVFDTLRLAYCQHSRLQNIQANYLDIIACRIEIENSEIIGQAEAVQIKGSEVQIINTSIQSIRVGLRTRGSEITMTLSKVAADTAIATTSSRFDLAAVELLAINGAVCVDKKALNSTKNISDVLLSVSKIYSPHHQGSIHKFCNVSPEKSL